MSARNLLPSLCTVHQHHPGYESLEADCCMDCLSLCNAPTYHPIGKLLS